MFSARELSLNCKIVDRISRVQRDQFEINGKVAFLDT